MPMKIIINFSLFTKGDSDNIIKMCIFPGCLACKKIVASLTTNVAALDK